MSDSRAPTPYERFVEAAKVIFSVPKKEVDQAIQILAKVLAKAKAVEA